MIREAVEYIPNDELVTWRRTDHHVFFALARDVKVGVTQEADAVFEVSFRGDGFIPEIKAEEVFARHGDDPGYDERRHAEG